jgi:hypothetical protein
MSKLTAMIFISLCRTTQKKLSLRYAHSQLDSSISAQAIVLSNLNFSFRDFSSILFIVLYTHYYIR